MSNQIKTTITSYNKTAKQHIDKTGPYHPYDQSRSFMSYLPKDAIILDLGCGPGRDAEVFIDAGYQVVGIDLAKKMIAAARKRIAQAQFHVMDMMNLDFADNTFDGIWASASFLHIAKQYMNAALAQACRVLKPGGVFYISMKQGNTEETKPDERFGGVEKFWSFFQPQELRDYLTRAKLEILEHSIQPIQDSYATNPWMYFICRRS